VRSPELEKFGLSSFTELLAIAAPMTLLVIFITSLDGKGANITPLPTIDI
jgi:hypothetical protein